MEPTSTPSRAVMEYMNAEYQRGSCSGSPDGAAAARPGTGPPSYAAEPAPSSVTCEPAPTRVRNCSPLPQPGATIAVARAGTGCNTSLLRANQPAAWPPEAGTRAGST